MIAAAPNTRGAMQQRQATMPHPNRRDLPFAKLSDSLQRALRWLNACVLLRHDDLIAVAWPIEPNVQRARHTLRGWADDGFISPVGDSSGADERRVGVFATSGLAYRLGPRGVERLREAGVALHQRSDEPAPRVRTGLLLAGAFVVGLARDLASDPSVAHFSWSSTPFLGDTVRADGEGALCYAAHPQPSSDNAGQDAAAQEVWSLAMPESAPTPGQLRVELTLEVDSGTETSAQLAARAARWRTVLRERRAALRSGCWLQVLWVTDGGWERADTIWRAWIAHARFPLFITTVSTLTLDGGLRPWLALWRDEHGRPRTLNPHRSQEPIWRPQASVAPAATTLPQAIAAWETTQRM
jgi:hypothetical protein